jgi:hypothetical protein
MFEIIKNPEFIVNMALHSAILFTFLSLFFKYYISKLSTSAFNTEINNMINESMEHNIHLLKNNNTVKALPKNHLNYILSKPDKVVETHNNGLFNSVLVANTMVWIIVVILILVFKYSCNSDINLTDILTENAVAFTIIGIFEYLFFTKIAFKFVPVLPSFISNQSVSILKSKLE